MLAATTEETIVRMDKYYAPLAAKHGHKQAVKAGWFEEKLHEPLQTQPWLLTADLTPMYNQTRPVVLYMTGGIAPLHEGHLMMLEAAREAVEAYTGKTVQAAYISPDHDVYATSKEGAETYTAPSRITAAEELIHTTGRENWVKTDRWASMHAPTELNLTTIIERFIEHVTHQLDTIPEVWYVCGSDNSALGNAFTFEGQAVIVEREGSPTQELLPEANVIHAKTVIPNYNSTSIRARHKAEKANVEAGQGAYLIRNDLHAACPNSYNYDSIVETIKMIINLHTPAGVHAEETSLSNVESTLDPATTISMDVFTGDIENMYRLHLTRKFNPASWQQHSTEMIERPGHPKLHEQLALIPAGDYCLLDDDTATGWTFKQVTKILSEYQINAVSQRTLLTADNTTRMFDIVDARDFIIGSQEGGLTVTTPNGEATRTVYAHPYVNLTTRAKISPELVHSFSYCVWALNYHLFSGTNLTLQDVASTSQQDYTLFNFPSDMTVEEFTKRHMKVYTV